MWGAGGPGQLPQPFGAPQRSLSLRGLSRLHLPPRTLSTLGWLSALGLGCLFCIETPATETAAQPITVTAAESSRQGG